ncbi:MAG: DUF6744 family protein, partial [Flavonifractor plautii]
MNQTNNTIQFSQFAAVSKDSDEVLGKILYYTLSSILIDREVLARLCDTVDFPYFYNGAPVNNGYGCRHP